MTQGEAVRAEVPVELLREAYARRALTMAEVARRAGYNPSVIERVLGTRPVDCYRKGKHYGPYHVKRVTYEKAVRIARAMDFDPVELGL